MINLKKYNIHKELPHRPESFLSVIQIQRNSTISIISECDNEIKILRKQTKKLSDQMQWMREKDRRLSEHLQKMEERISELEKEKKNNEEIITELSAKYEPFARNIDRVIEKGNVSKKIFEWFKKFIEKIQLNSRINRLEEWSKVQENTNRLIASYAKNNRNLNLIENGNILSEEREIVTISKLPTRPKRNTFSPTPSEIAKYEKEKYGNKRKLSSYHSSYPSLPSNLRHSNSIPLDNPLASSSSNILYQSSQSSYSRNTQWIQPIHYVQQPIQPSTPTITYWNYEEQIWKPF